METGGNLIFTNYEPPEPLPPDFCECGNPGNIKTAYGDFGFFAICGNCGRPVRGNFHFYDNADAEETDILIFPK